MTSHILKLTPTINMAIDYSYISTQNCGIGGLADFRFYNKGVEISRTGRDWETKYDWAAGDRLNKTQTLKLLRIHIYKIAAIIGTSPIMFISDRVASGPSALLSSMQDDKNLTTEAKQRREKQAIGTVDLFSVLRQTRCGFLMSSPVVENPIHSGDSAIMAALWMPPAQFHRWLGPKFGVSGLPSSNTLKLSQSALTNHPPNPLLSKHAAEFVEKFYG